MSRWLVPFASGVVFGVGLVISGMTQPARVMGFLDLFGAWDPTLALVMTGAIGVHFLVYRLVVPRMAAPAYGGSFPPAPQGIDARLVAGATVFGVGWGLGGFCPAPAVASLASGGIQAWAFIPAMLAGMLLYRLVDGRTAAGRAPVPVSDA